MATGKSIETRAVVLSEMVYKESSKILTLYTEEIGKISLLAKGVMSAKSSSIAICQTYSHGRYFLSKGRNFYYLNRGILLDSNLHLRSSYSKMIYSSLIVEIVNKTTIEGSKNAKIYALLAKGLSQLALETNEKLIVCAFLIKYISFMGYRPKIPSIYKNPMVFSPTLGGIIEGESRDYGGYSIDQKDLELFKRILYTSLEELSKIEDRGNLNKIFEILIAYIQVNLEVDKIHSLHFFV